MPTERCKFDWSLAFGDALSFLIWDESDYDKLLKTVISIDIVTIEVSLIRSCGVIDIFSFMQINWSN